MCSSLLKIGTQFYNHLSNIFDLSRCTSPYDSLCCTQTPCDWNTFICNTGQNNLSSYYTPHDSGSNTNSFHNTNSISFPNNTDCRFDITNPSWFVLSIFLCLSISFYLSTRSFILTIFFSPNLSALSKNVKK